jgi:hypothetical protein
LVNVNQLSVPIPKSSSASKSSKNSLNNNLNEIDKSFESLNSEKYEDSTKIEKNREYQLFLFNINSI